MEKGMMIGASMHIKKCRYCGKEFMYIWGANDPMGQHHQASRDRDEHERVCTERFLYNAQKNTNWSDIEDLNIEKIMKIMRIKDR